MLLKYELGWVGGLVLREKMRDSVFKGFNFTNQELAQVSILASSALIESAASWGSILIFRVVSSANRRIGV